MKHGRELGSDTTRSDVPVPVCKTIETPCQPEHYLKEVTAIAAGAHYSLALLKNGTAMAWGENEFGTLGDGTKEGPEICNEEACSRVPIAVNHLSEVAAISAAGFHSLALLKNGTVMAWGYGGEGALGNGAIRTSDLPEAVCAAGEPSCANDLSHVTSIAAGRKSSLALLESGTVVAWGSDIEGQLGDGSLGGSKHCGTRQARCSSTPVRVTGIGEANAISADVNGSDNMALLKTGALVSWGGNSNGELGDGSTVSSDEPTRVCAPYVQSPCPSGPYLSGDVAAFAAGGDHELASVKSSSIEVTSVTPDVGPTKGKTKVTITGTNLDAATAVDFGAAEASDVQVISPGEIAAVSPAGSEPVAVTVKTPEGESPPGPSDQFTYETAPGVTTATGFASGLASATLNATVNPDGAAVSECYFDYGTSPAYGSSASCESPPGSGGNPVPVFASAHGLAPGTLYYFRIVATNTHGTGRGAQQTLQTLAEELPEFGRCIKLAPGSDGRYKTSACTKLSAGGDSGRFEWQPWPLHDNGFSSKGGTAKLETPEGVAVSCRESSFTGEYAGRQLGRAPLALTGCEASGRSLVFEGGISGACQSEGAPAAEIKTGPLSATIGVIKAGKKPSIGWDLKPVSGSDLAVFECSPSYPIHLAGSVIAPVTRVNKMVNSFTLNYSASNGRQAVETLGTVPDVLAVRANVGSVEGEEPIGLTMTSSIGNEQAPEIKAIL